VEFPNTNIVRNVQDYQTRQLTTEEGNLFGPIRIGHNQHTHTGSTGQPELNSRVPYVHPPSRAQLEGCHSEPQLKECHMLNPYPELNSRDTFQATTQGTPASRPLRYPRSLVDHAHHSKQDTNLLQQNRLALLMRRQPLSASRPPSRGHVPPGT